MSTRADVPAVRQDRDEYQRVSREVWDHMAPGWERWRAQLADGLTPVREWLIGELAPAPGDTVLELGAGPGETGFHAASLLGEHGRLISSDFSAAMVDVARRRRARLGLGNVEHRVIDAHDVKLRTGAVDGVLCQSGYMLMADPAAALAETRRVLKPGGRLALSVWGAPERNPWALAAVRLLVERGHVAPPEPGAPGVFSMAGEELTRGLLEDAGFSAIRTEEVPVHFRYQGVDDYAQWVAGIAGPIAMVVRALPPDERRLISGQLAEAFEPFRCDGGYRVPGVALCAVAS